MDITRLMNEAKNAGPPKNVEPSELVRRLMDSKRPSELLPFIRCDEEGNPLCEYRMVILTQEEIDGCYANAEAHTRRLFKDKIGATDSEMSLIRREAWNEVYENAKAVEVLYAAMRDKDDVNKRLFMAPSEIRKHLTMDECASLFHAYEEVQFKWGPLWKLLTDEEVDAWLDKLTEGASGYPLGHLGQGALTQLIVSLAYRLKTLRSAIGSFGLPSDDTATSTSPNSLE